MFYSIAPEHKNNYPNHYQLGPFAISTDSGWSQQGNYLFKGYADDFKLADKLDSIVSQHEPTNLGNYTVLYYTGTQLKICSDRFRSYPLYMKDREVTNLEPGGETAWTDSLLTINNDFSVIEDKFDVIGNINTTPLTFNQALDQVDNILATRTQNFLKHNTTPIRTFTSGGVDSTLVLSYLSKYTDNYTQVKCSHIDYDKFWLLNSMTLQVNYWGYQQIHHWIEPTILTSGAPGDEFMLRSPTTINWLLRNNGYTMKQLLNSTEYMDCLHSKYFKLDKHIEIFDQEFAVVPQEQLIRTICNTLANDWQHWHLGNTITWTPLRDLEITKIMLRIPIQHLLGQIMNSSFSRELINKNNPALNQVISDKKNSGNYMSNLVNWYAANK